MTTKKCFYCGDALSEWDFLTDWATMIMPQTYAHTDCIDSRGDESIVIRKCLYCDEALVVPEFETGLAIKTGRDRYAHIACIASHGREGELTEKCFFCGKEVTGLELEAGKALRTLPGLYAHYDCIASDRKEETVAEETQLILGAADSAHQGIELSISLLQEALGSMGEILTEGCSQLGPASLGSTMRLGQHIKEIRFMLDATLRDAHGLCILLGNDLDILDGESERVKVVPPVSFRGDDFHECMFGNTAPEKGAGGESSVWERSPMDVLDSEDLEPGEDEFGDDEIPF